MQKTLKKLAFLFALVCTVICCVALVACADKGSGDGGNGDGGDENKITYSLTVTSDDSELDFTLITAQWKDNTEVKGSAKLSETGTASVQLESGSYTVSLIDVPEGYAYSEVSATTVKSEVEIKITKESTIKQMLLAVTLPNGLPFPADAAVQVYDQNGDEVGGLQTIDTSRNCYINVSKKGTSRIVFVSAVDYLEGETTVDATDNFAALALNASNVEYTVAVTVGENVELDGVTLALNNGTKDVATEEIVESGEIAITAPAGIYTVEVRGLGAQYEYENAYLSYDSQSRTAELEILAIVYIVNFETLNTSIDLSTVTVELLNGKTVVTQATVEGTVAKLYAATGEYTINAISSQNYGYIIGEFDHNREATVKVAPIPEGGTEYLNNYGKGQGGDSYKINATGGYYIEVLTYLETLRNVYDARKHTFTFTAPEEDRTLYTFSWQYVAAGDSITKVYNYGTATEFVVEDVSISYILSKGETVDFALIYTPAETYNSETGTYSNNVTEDPLHFVLTVEADVAPLEGEIMLPKEIKYAEIEREHTGPEGMADVYFKLMPSYNSGRVFIVTFAEGTAVYFGSNINSLSSVKSGGSITIGDYSVTYLRVTADSAPVKFTIQKYFVPGESPIHPIELLQGEENRLEFDFSGGSQTVWLVFTPSVTGTYYIYGELDPEAIAVGTKYNDYGGSEYDIYWPPIGYNGDQLSLTAGTKYYLMLSGPWGSKASFYIDLYNG